MLENTSSTAAVSKANPSNRHSLFHKIRLASHKVVKVSYASSKKGLRKAFQKGISLVSSFTKNATPVTSFDSTTKAQQQEQKQSWKDHSVDSGETLDCYTVEIGNDHSWFNSSVTLPPSANEESEVESGEQGESETAISVQHQSSNTGTSSTSNNHHGDKAFEEYLLLVPYHPTIRRTNSRATCSSASTAVFNNKTLQPGLVKATSEVRLRYQHFYSKQHQDDHHHHQRSQQEQQKQQDHEKRDAVPSKTTEENSTDEDSLEVEEEETLVILQQQQRHSSATTCGSSTTCGERGCYPLFKHMTCGFQLLANTNKNKNNKNKYNNNNIQNNSETEALEQKATTTSSKSSETKKQKYKLERLDNPVNDENDGDETSRTNSKHFVLETTTVGDTLVHVWSTTPTRTTAAENSEEITRENSTEETKEDVESADAVVYSPDELNSQLWHKQFLQQTVQRIIEDQKTVQREEKEAVRPKPTPIPTSAATATTTTTNTINDVEHHDAIEPTASSNGDPFLISILVEPNAELLAAHELQVEKEEEKVNDQSTKEDARCSSQDEDQMLDDILDKIMPLGEDAHAPFGSPERTKEPLINPSQFGDGNNSNNFAKFDHKFPSLEEINQVNQGHGASRGLREGEQFQDIHRPFAIAEAKLFPPPPPPLPPPPFPLERVFADEISMRQYCNMSSSGNQEEKSSESVDSRLDTTTLSIKHGSMATTKVKKGGEVYGQLREAPSKLSLRTNGTCEDRPFDEITVPVPHHFDIMDKTTGRFDGVSIADESGSAASTVSTLGLSVTVDPDDLNTVMCSCVGEAVGRCVDTLDAYSDDEVESVGETLDDTFGDMVGNKTHQQRMR